MDSWGSYDSHSNVFKLANFAAALSFGKYISPYSDVRFQFFYGRGTGVRGADNYFNAKSYPYDLALLSAFLPSICSTSPTSSWATIRSASSQSALWQVLAWSTPGPTPRKNFQSPVFGPRRPSRPVPATSWIWSSVLSLTTRLLQDCSSALRQSTDSLMIRSMA